MCIRRGLGAYVQEEVSSPSKIKIASVRSWAILNP